jgi:hypothetical protein
MGQARHHQWRGTDIGEAHRWTRDAAAERSAPVDGRRAIGAVEVRRGSGTPVGHGMLSCPRRPLPPGGSRPVAGSHAVEVGKSGGMGSLPAGEPGRLGAWSVLSHILWKKMGMVSA